jgi:predicted MFS family arabinose efflux permease
MRALLPRLLVPILMLAAFVSGLQPVILSPLLPAIARAFAVSPAAAGQLATAAALTSAATALLVVPLIDRFARRTILLVEATTLLAATLLSALAPSLGWLFAARIAAGVGSALILPTTLAAAGDFFVDPVRRNRVVGLITAAASAAVVLGLPVLAQLVAHVGWRGALVAAVAPAAVVLLGARGLPAAAVAHRDERGWHAYGQRYRAVLAHRETVWLLGATLLFGAGWSGWFIYIGAYAITTFAVSAAFLSALFLVAGVAEVFGSVVTPWLLHVTTARALTVIGLALTATDLAALGVVFTRASMLFTFITIASVLGAVVYTTISVMALDAVPEARGAVLTLRAALFSVGWGIGPTTTGVALAVFGDYRAGYRALGALSVLGIGCLMMSARRASAVSEGEIEQHPI